MTTRSLIAPLSDVRKELAQLQTTLQQRVDEGVSTAMAASVRQWLEPVRNVADAVARAQESALPTRAAEALEKQRSVDRHYGNRTALTRTIEEQRQMLADVQRARIDALNPLPELASIAADLERTRTFSPPSFGISFRRGFACRGFIDGAGSVATD